MQGNLSGLPVLTARSYWGADPIRERGSALFARTPDPLSGPCYLCPMFNFGKPKTASDWMVHIAGAIVAILLVWWMLRMYVL